VGNPGRTKEPKLALSFHPEIAAAGSCVCGLVPADQIQETVYELLTQQYELAKVQEAKEIPTVRVLDPAIVPTKKSFPLVP